MVNDRNRGTEQFWSLKNSSMAARSEHAVDNLDAVVSMADRAFGTAQKEN